MVKRTQDRAGVNVRKLWSASGDEADAGLSRPSRPVVTLIGHPSVDLRQEII